MREICRQVANLLDRRTKTVALPTSLDGLSLAGNVYGGRIKILSYSVNQQPADACKGTSLHKKRQVRASRHYCMTAMI